MSTQYVNISFQDVGTDKYIQKRPTKILGRQYDSKAITIKITRPQSEDSSSLFMIVTHNKRVVDNILVKENEVQITRALSKYKNINIGFSFTRPDGYVKNSSIEEYLFLDAQDPDSTIETEPEQQISINRVISESFINVDWKQGTHNTLQFKNVNGEVVNEIELSGFVQEQSDLAELDSTKETFVKGKSTKNLLNEGEDGSSPYATQKFVSENGGKIDTVSVDGEQQEIINKNVNISLKPIKDKIDEVENIAKGLNQAITYGDYQTMITAFNSIPKDTYKVGQNVMIVALNVPDLWVSYIEENSVTYSYVDDNSFVSQLSQYGYVQVGFYRLSALETQKVNLTNYVTFDDTAEAGGGYGLVKVGTGGTGIQLNKNGVLQSVSAPDSEIETESESSYRNLQPRHISKIVKKGLSNSIETWTDEEKQSARDLIVAVGKNDYATNSSAGVIVAFSELGLSVSQTNGLISVVEATEEQITERTNKYNPITPNNLDYAVNSVLKERITATQLEDGSYSLTINTEV